MNDLINTVYLAKQIRRQAARTLQLERLVNGRPAKVKIHQQRFGTGLGHHNGMVTGNKGLALGGYGAGDGHHVEIAGALRKRNGRANGAERFR